MIEVRFFATFRDGRGKSALLEAKDYENIGAILKHFRITREEIAILLLNGIYIDSDAPVKDGDIVALFPPVGGG
ncbi:MAG: MoaD/ThiS family protein [Oscillospiraceae bacterium]